MTTGFVVPVSSAFVRSDEQERGLARGRPRRLRKWTSARWYSQMNSDPRPTEEYFEYLAKKSTSEEDGPEMLDQPSVIVGAGRIGSLLRTLGQAESRDEMGDLLPALEQPDIIVSRGDPIPKLDKPRPIYLATRNEALATIIEEQCPKDSIEDLIFLQNGFIEPELRKYGLLNDPEITLVNVYFAVAKLGDDPIDGVTSLSPEGLTLATGKWAPAIAARLRKGGLKCRVVGSRDFRRSMLAKLVWISVMNLIGAVHGGITVGEVVKSHRAEVDEMVREMSLMIRFTLAVAMFPDLNEQLCSYSLAVANFPTAIKEFKWRNGWFYEQSQIAIQNGFADPTPMHTDYLVDGKRRGLIDW